MARLLLAVAALAAFAACGASTATQENRPQERTSDVDASSAISVPENPSDRRIRRDLNLALSHDTALKDRRISFIVSNGDVNVTGTVRTEEERTKINELALNVEGVKSVANGVLIVE